MAIPGGVLAQIVAIDHPDSVVGIHLTDLGWHVDGTDPATVTHVERRWLEASKQRAPTFRAASPRPCRLAGRARVVDRRSLPRAGERLGRDELLANIMLYWVTNTIGSSMFGEVADRRSPSLSPTDYVTRPVALALSERAPRDPPRRLAERTLDVAWWTELPLEEPDQLRRRRSRLLPRAARAPRDARRSCAMTVRRFELRVDDEELEELAARLATTRLPPAIDGDWDTGTNHLAPLLEHWRTAYDWRAREAEINRFEQFVAELRGGSVHYIHERGHGPAPLPIVLTHGYPDSFLRFRKLIPLLVDPRSRRRVRRRRAEPARVRVFRRADPARRDLSRRGSVARADGRAGSRATRRTAAIGSLVTEHLGRGHASAVVGVHLSTDVPFWHLFERPRDASPDERAYIASSAQWQPTERAYATRPRARSPMRSTTRRPGSPR